MLRSMTPNEKEPSSGNTERMTYRYKTNRMVAVSQGTNQPPRNLEKHRFRSPKREKNAVLCTYILYTWYTHDANYSMHHRYRNIHSVKNIISRSIKDDRTGKIHR